MSELETMELLDGARDAAENLGSFLSEAAKSIHGGFNKGQLEEFTHIADTIRDWLDGTYYQYQSNDVPPEDDWRFDGKETSDYEDWKTADDCEREKDLLKA